MEGASMRTALKGLDTSGVEVHDHKELLVVEAGSAEEAKRETEVEALLVEQGVMTRWEAFKLGSVYTELPLWCLRARAHVVERAAELLPRVMSMMEELEIGGGNQAQLRNDLESKAFVDIGRKDAHGRAVIWMRGRYINPRRSSSTDIARLFATVLLHALRDTSVQQHGFVWLADTYDVSMTNVTPATINAFWRVVMPNMPIRLGVVFMVNPPWIVSQIMFPIISTFLSAKVRKKHVMIYGARKELWAAQLVDFDVPITSIPIELGGTAHVDVDAYIASVCMYGNIATTCDRRTRSSSTASISRAPTLEVILPESTTTLVNLPKSFTW